MDAEEAELFPDRYPGWDGELVSGEVWLSSVGRYDQAVAYARLFWPSFSVVGDCVLMGSDYLTPRELQGDRTSVEKLKNHRHLGRLFPGAPRPNAAQLRCLGQALREMWTAKLARDFPHRRFVVWLSEEFDPGVDDPQITFWQA